MTSSSASLVPFVSRILVRIRGDPQPGQRQRKMLAQGQIAERMAVFEQMGSVLAREHVEALANAIFVEPGIRQPRTSREHEPSRHASEADEQARGVASFRLMALRCGWKPHPARTKAVT